MNTRFLQKRKFAHKALYENANLERKEMKCVRLLPNSCFSVMIYDRYNARLAP